MSGAIAGIAGVSEVAGIQYRLTSGLSPGYGYTGIVVAMLGGLTMPGVLASAFLLGDLNVGASSAERSLGHPVADGCGRPGHAAAVGRRALLALRRWRVRREEPPPADAELRSTDDVRSTDELGQVRRMTFLIDLLAATFRNATPLVYGTVGETVTERAGVLNLGIEGTMYAGAFAGFAVAFATGDPLIGLLAAILVGLAAGAVMGFLTVTLGANQHVSGLGLTIVLIGLAELGNRLLLTGSEVQRITPMEQLEPARRSSARSGDDRAAVRADLCRVPGRGARSPGGCSAGRRSACRSARSVRTPRPPTRRASTSHASATRRS